MTTYPSVPTQLEQYLGPEAGNQLRRLTPEQQSAAARVHLPLIAKLEKAGWRPRASKVLASDNDELPQLLYDLTGKRADLRDCRLNLSHEQPQGQCGGGFSYAPAFENQRHDVPAPLVLHPALVPFAETVEEVEVPVTTKVLTRGRVQIFPDDVRLLEGELLVPYPLDEEKRRWGPIRHLSLALDLDIVSRARTSVDLVLPMPAGVEPIPLAHLDALITVDLRPADGLFLLEGEMKVVGQGSGSVRVLYFPGRYASLQLGAVTLPVAPPYFCLGVESLLIEADVESKRFRLAFGAEIGPAEALACALADEQNGLLPGKRVAFNLMGRLVDGTLELFKVHTGVSLPDTFRAGGHLVVDPENGVICLDLGLQSTSLFKGAYFLVSETLITEAPVQISSRLATPEDLQHLASKLTQAPANFPDMDPDKCWDADPGPRANILREEIHAKISELG